MKKLQTSLLILLMMFISMTMIQAKNIPQKEEIVYSKMDLNGSVESVFVVNAFDVTKENETIIDYGEYKSVVNTTTNQAIDFNGKKIKIEDVKKGRFFYQGELSGSTQLPWLLEIEYFLDNQPIGGADLGGKSGKLKIVINAKQNKNVDPVYFDNYLLTMTFNIDSKLAENIVAKDATIGNAGDKKTIVFTSLPKKEATYTITADVTDFVMDGIQIAALPFSMAIELPDISQFTDGIGDLADGIAQLNNGANQLAWGINQLNNNSSGLNSGANQLSSGASEISSGLNQTVSGTQAYVDGVAQYTGGVNQLASGSVELVNGSVQIKDGIHLLATELNNNAGMLNITPEQQALIDASVVALNNLKSFLQNDLGSAVFLPVANALKRETVLALYPQLDPNDPNTALLLNYMDVQARAIESSYNLLAPVQEAIKNELVPRIDQMINMISGISQFSQLIAGVNQLDAQYALFHDGLVSLSDGLSQLDSGSGQLVSGGNQLTSGLNQLKDGANQFSSGVQQYADGVNQYTNGVSQLSSGANQLSSGTNQLHDATSDIGPLMEEKIQELMKDYEFEDFEMKSFVSSENTDVKLVQFVYMTQPIEKPVVAQEVVTEEVQKSFWDLILDLFK